MFVLHEKLMADTVAVGDLPLSRVLLMNDSQYPWAILVPRRNDVTECYELTEEDQQQLWTESSGLSKLMMGMFAGHKLNVAALGNVVPQLHLHHIVRYHHDVAWPKPIWGVSPSKAYPAVALNARVSQLVDELSRSNRAFKPL